MYKKKKIKKTGRVWRQFYVPGIADILFFRRDGIFGYLLESFTTSPKLPLVSQFTLYSRLDRSDNPDHEVVMSDFIKRSLERGTQVGSPLASCTDAKFLQRYPAIGEYLTTTSVDGKPWRSASLTVSWDHGQFRLFLNDRQRSLSLCAVGDTFEGALKALEASLACDEPSWRHNEGNGNPRVKRPPGQR